MGRNVRMHLTSRAPHTHVHVLPSQQLPVVDKEGRVFIVLAGMPEKGNWSEVNENASNALEAARAGEEPEYHRRGKHVAATMGISDGQGSSVRGNIG